ncbi:hypothetical protein FD21_GL001865 [Liquorilactobacillus vini DSM 20605]|uniref:Glycoside hydrolase family 38 central domain-containing protein n=1 Tax=Liquorilactobacillus vini DSM 20605 TaxID=1133569 RepID=A0A0R2CAM7_9LACO|nr:hypothetical protein FD21_GL001865 [Liquorilactobacillus vini DSM 20605]
MLRNQFHDILPGSAICEVYKDAYQEFEYLFNKVKSLKKGLHKLNSRKTDENKNYMILRNFLPWKRKSLVELPSGFIPRLDEHVVQYEKVKDQKVYTLIEVPAFGEIEVMELV